MGVQKDLSVAAGRGVVLITGAKLYFMVAGYAVQFLLPRLFADAAEYGVYSTVIVVVSIVNNVLITGTIQGVSRFSAEEDARAPAVLRTALGVQLLLGLTVAGAYFGIAPWLASSFLHKPSLTPYLWLSAIVVFAYSLYAALVGSLNGRKLFHRQATLDITFSTLRTGLTLGLAAAGFGVLGAVGGFTMAATAILVVALLWVGIGRRGPGLRPLGYVAFVAPLFGYHLLLNGVLQVDLVLLSRAASMTAEAGGLVGAAAEEAANAQAGYYKAVQNLAFIPYQLILSVAFVVFPLVSRSMFQKDLTATRTYIRNALRFSLLVSAGVAVCFAARSGGVLTLVFPAGYDRGSTALSVLAGGVVAFALFVLVCTILNGAGRVRVTMALAGLALTGVVVLNLLLVPGREGAAALTAAAIATSSGMALGLVTGGILLVRTFGAFLPAGTALRTAIACAAVFAAGRLLPETGKAATLGVLAGLFLLYVAVLAVLRELGAEDLRQARRILRGR